MTIFNLATGLSDIFHAHLAEVVSLGIRSALVITALVDSRELLIIVEDYIIFQLAHGMELHAGNLTESLASLVQGIFG